MTQTTVEKPELGKVVGQYGGARTGFVKGLLARTNVNTGQLTTEIVRRMRRHYQVISCLTVQSLPLIRAEWVIEHDDPDVAEALTAAYRAIAFPVHRSMTRCLWAGYSPNEIVWDYRGDLRGIYPVRIRDLDPDTCKPATDDLGELGGFVQQVGGAGETIEAVYALWIVEGMESGNYYGRSILDGALDPWADYAAFRAFHARYLERFGEPVVLCRAPAGKSIANQVEIENAVLNNQTPPAPVLVDNMAEALNIGENLRHHSVVALPSDLLFGADGKPTGFAWNLEFVTADGGKGTDFLEAIRETDQRIARAMFVPDLLLSNTADVGSNALGQSHRTVWSESIEGRLDDYSLQITEQLVEPMRLLNYPDSGPARLVFQPLADEDLDRWWALATELVAGGKLPVDVVEIGQRLGIPLGEVEEEPEVEEPPVVEAPVEEDLRHVPGDPGQRADAAPFAHHAPHRFAADNPVAGLPDWKLPQDYDAPAWRRALNNREQRVGFAQIEEGLNAGEALVIDQLDEILGREHDRILRQLTGIVKKGSVAEVLTALGTLEIKGATEVVGAWSGLMDSISRLALERLKVEVPAAAAKIPDALGREGRALFAAYAGTAADRALSSLLTETRLQLLNAYTSGVSRAGMASIVGQVFDAYTASEGKPMRLTTRMLSAKSLNYSRAAGIERSGIPLAGAQYSAVLDRRTCDLCESCDELVIPIEHTDLSRFTPPVHHNCRCVWVWITREEEDFTPTWVTPSRTKVDSFGGLVL